MATLDAQERVLANKEHVINGVSFTSVKKINKQMSNVLAAYWSHDQSKSIGIFI